MGKGVMVILDSDEVYAERFASYARKQKLLPFESMAFTSLEKLEIFTEKKRIALLLMSEHMAEERAFKIPADKQVVLDEKSGKPIQESLCYVDKYQSCKKILQELLRLYEGERIYSGIRKRSFLVVGVFSPLGRSGKTSFALELGHFLSKCQKVLYLNLEAFSGFQKLVPDNGGGSISDLFYLLLQENGHIFARLPGLVRSVGELDYIPPVQVPEDLELLETEIWDALFSELEEMSRYEVILLDLGRSIQEAEELLKRCSRIFVPELRDSISLAKMEQFETVIKQRGQEELLERMEKLAVPRSFDGILMHGGRREENAERDAFIRKVWGHESI